MTVTGSSARARSRATHLPGEPGIWVFVCGDLIVFGLFFVTFLYYRSLDPALFVASRDMLNKDFGAINTVLLLSSSWFVAMAVPYAREGRGRTAASLFAAAFICGLGFAIIKYLEYGEKISHGITLTTNDFFMFYFMLTGIHFLHVVLGMVVLGLLYRTSLKPDPGSRMIAIECGATFWHMVDLLWLVLFPLLYLMK